MTQPTRRGCPLSLQYACHLTSSERPWADPDRQGSRRAPVPGGVQREQARARLQCDEGLEDEGGPDATIAAALDMSARNMGRQAVEAGRGAGEAQLLQLARARVARGIASRISYAVRRVLKKRADALASGAAGLSAGGGLRDPEGKGAGPLPPALRCARSGDRQGRTAPTAAGRPAAVAAGASGPSRHLRL